MFVRTKYNVESTLFYRNVTFGASELKWINEAGVQIVNSTSSVTITTKTRAIITVVVMPAGYAKKNEARLNRWRGQNVHKKRVAYLIRAVKRITGYIAGTHRLTSNRVIDRSTVRCNVII